MSSEFQNLVNPASGEPAFDLDTGAIPGTAAKMRGLFVDPSGPPFPIYASEGEALASVGAGGLSFDANGRLRVTQTVPGTPVQLPGGILSDDSGALVVAQGTGGAISPEVQAVFDRMSALTQTEQDAIIAYVDGMVADGYYSEITEIYAPCLNATDYKTGFKFMSLVDSAIAPIHTPGEYADFNSNSMHFLDSANYDTFANAEGFIGVYNVFTAADSTANADLFGVADVTNECYFRWRGNDTNDFNAIYNVSSGTPRTAANQRPTGDIVGVGLDGGDIFNLQPGGIIVKATRTPTAVPAGFPMQWHGQNLNGSPATGNVQNSRYSLMMHSNGHLATQVQGALRTRSLDFLKAIGVTGVP